MSQNFNYFTPITPSKTLNCVLSSAISFDNYSSINLNYEPFGFNSVPNALPSINETEFVAAAGVTTDSRGDVEVIITPPKNKKQKVNSDRKPGEKRQNKYFWAKIDVPKPYTPASKTSKVTPKPPKSKTPKSSKPKTPKVATPKPKRENDKIKPIDCSKISEHVEGEPILASTCKRSLNFEATKVIDLESFNVPKEVLENVNEKTTMDTTCTKGLNLGDGDNSIIEVKPYIKIKKKVTLVYKRRSNSKCLSQCRKLAPNFEESFKKKRLRRKKMSFGALEKFKGFNHTYLDRNLLDRILTVKGKLRMLLPTKGDLTEDSHGCVYSLLSLRVPFKKNKRLSRARHSTKQLVDLDEPIHLAAHPSPPTVEPLKDKSNGENISTDRSSNSDVDLTEHEVNIDKAQPCTDQSRVFGEQTHRESEAQLFTSTPCTPKGPTEGRRGRKTNVTKEKNSRRPYKKRGKKYLSNYIDEDELSEKILEDFTEKFGSMRLDDIPQTWLMVVDDQDNKSDTLHGKKLEEERAKLKEKTDKFVNVMCHYQGSKEFIKWNGSVLDSVVGVFLTQNVSDILSSNAYMSVASKYPIKPPTSSDSEVNHEDAEGRSSQGPSEIVRSSPQVIIEHPDEEKETAPGPIDDGTTPEFSKEDEEYNALLSKMLDFMHKLLEDKKKGKTIKGEDFDWESLRVRFLQKSPRKPEYQDSVDWEAVRKTHYLKTAEVIRHRGQHRIIAEKIQNTLNRLLERHGSLDLEWLRNAPPVVAKAYLLSFYGLGLKSVECLRLLTLRHPGFPVDVNISRIAIRLGWVPIKPLPPGMPFHLLQKYPLEDEIQKYLWPRLCHLGDKLYTLHYQMITFGKVFCQKRGPNCRACPFKSDCKYYASLSESRRLALPGPKDRKSKKSKKHEIIPNPFNRITRRPTGSLPRLTSRIKSCTDICVWSTNLGSYPQLPITTNYVSQNPEYFVEVPLSPVREEEEEEEHVRNAEAELVDIEDCCDGYTYHLKLNTEDKKRSSLNNCQENDMSSQNVSSREMVFVSPNETFALPKQVNVGRLRTEHQVYELPREHPLLDHLNLEPQLGGVPYLLAIWTPGQVEKSCDNTEECPCASEGECTCQQDSLTIPGTLLIPVRTAMRAFFPLNGTYFQTNEVFVDHETCERPLNVPTNWIWNLKKRTLYCGSSTSAIVKGTTEMEIQQCFCEGFVCTRGFNRQTRAPEALSSKFHYRPKAKSQHEKEDAGGIELTD